MPLGLRTPPAVSGARAVSSASCSLLTQKVFLEFFLYELWGGAHSIGNQNFQCTFSELKVIGGLPPYPIFPPNTSDLNFGTAI